LFAGLDLRQRLLEFLSKQGPVRQIRERVVVCEMGDLLLGARLEHPMQVAALVIDTGDTRAVSTLRQQ